MALIFRYGKNLLIQYESVLQQKNIHRVQKARVDWLHFGNNNATFSHTTINRKRASNKIWSLMDDTGNIINTTDAIGTLLWGYFAVLFTS